MLKTTDVDIGPDLDALIQERVFNGHPGETAPPYSQNADTAEWLAMRFELVVQPVYAMKPAWRNPVTGEISSPVMEYCVLRKTYPSGAEFLASGSTKALAICRAVLEMHGVAESPYERVSFDPAEPDRPN